MCLISLCYYYRQSKADRQRETKESEFLSRRPYSSLNSFNQSIIPRERKGASKPSRRIASGPSLRGCGPGWASHEGGGAVSDAKQKDGVRCGGEKESRSGVSTACSETLAMITHGTERARVGERQ